MKITPLDIQHKIFENQFRGYHRRQVDQFLEELAEAVEDLTRENASLKDALKTKEEELNELRRSEATLTSTLISTQSFVDHLKRGAQRDADLIVKEAELKAEEMLAHSRAELVDLQRAVSDLRRHRALVIERLRGTIQTFSRLIEVEAHPENQTDITEEAEWTSESASLPET